MNGSSKMLSSLCATVRDDLSKLRYTNVIFLDLGVKVDETTVSCYCHNSCRLPYVMSLANLCFRKQCHNIIGYAMFSDINISQGSVATPLTCGGICNDLIIANFLLSVTVKEFIFNVPNSLKYPAEYIAYFFGPSCTYKIRNSEKYVIYIWRLFRAPSEFIAERCCRASGSRKIHCGHKNPTQSGE